MGKRRQFGASLLRLLCQLRHARKGDQWVVQACDDRGRRTSLVIGVCEQGVTLTPGQRGRIVLAPLQAGQLRAGIRDAIEVLDRPDLAMRRLAHTQRVEAGPNPRTPSERERVVLSPRDEPVGVGRIAANIAQLNEEQVDDNADGTVESKDETEPEPGALPSDREVSPTGGGDRQPAWRWAS